MNKYFESKKPERYMTNDIHQSLPIGINIFLWECVDSIRSEVTPDYLQIFKLHTENTDTGELIQVIEHSQENPPYQKVYQIEADSEGINDTVYIIDDITHQTMLFARNY
jgi:hypothetical protein